MSHITNIVIALDSLEGFDDSFEVLEVIPGLRMINAWLEENQYGSLDRLDGHVQGGGKCMEMQLYGGAFNFLDVRSFVATVGSPKFKYQRNFSMLIVSEDDEGLFRIFGWSGGELKEGAWVPRLD